MNTSLKTILFIGALIVLAYVLYRGASSPVAPTVPEPIASIAYSCNGGKAFIASFYKGPSKPAASSTTPPTPSGSVTLKFSDGSTMSLAQTISADGARYANPDESFVFWGKGNGALVLEHNAEKTYIGCIAIAPEPSNVSLPLFYSNSQAGFSIRLPQGFTVDETYAYQELGPKKTIHGIKFTIAPSMATGTNLAGDSYISVEEIPQTAECSANLFLDGVKAVTATDGANTYSVATSTGAGAGNRYEEVVYAIPSTNPCVAVRYWVHYGVFENYPAGSVEHFDGQALLATLDAVRRTLVVVQ